MNTRWKVGLSIAVLGLVLGGAAASPRALRRMDGFRVRRVEVRGTRFLRPHEALRMSGISRQSNVFDDFSGWKAALELHPLIESVRIDRLLPATVRLWITETQPIALLTGAGAGELIPVTAHGVLLPIDPSTVDLDLPVVSAPAPKGGAGMVTDGRTLEVLKLLEAIRRTEPAMYGWISDAMPAGKGGVRVRLRSPAGAEALLSTDPRATQLHELKVTLADLAARQDIGRLIRVDARFSGQVVTTLAPVKSDE